MMGLHVPLIFESKGRRGTHRAFRIGRSPPLLLSRSLPIACSTSDAHKPNRLMKNHARFQDSRFAHGEHRAEALSLHPECAEQFESVEQDDVDRQRHIAGFSLYSVAKLQMMTEFAEGQNGFYRFP